MPLRRRIIRALAVSGAAALVLTAAYVALVLASVLPNPWAYKVEGDLAGARSTRPGIRVLFVGNSYTSRNALPALVADLARDDPGARPVFAVGVTAPASGLSRAAGQERLHALLREVRWDAVVLQERSRTPALSVGERHREMHPAARALHARIALAGARTILFMTWAYDQGDAQAGDGDTYAAMQARIERAYRELAADLPPVAAQRPAAVAPVGVAWASALEREPRLALWAGDGKHPSRLGSYLAACVIYAVLTGRDPAASRFTAGLDPRPAHLLQAVAAGVVSRDRGAR